MKKIFTAITVLILSSSCKKEVTPLSQVRTATERISSSGAVPFHVIVDESLDGSQFYNSCTNELISLYGSNHFVYHGFYDGHDSKTTANLTVPATVTAVYYSKKVEAIISFMS